MTWFSVPFRLKDKGFFIWGFFLSLWSSIWDDLGFVKFVLLESEVWIHYIYYYFYLESNIVVYVYGDACSYDYFYLIFNFVKSGNNSLNSFKFCFLS